MDQRRQAVIYVRASGAEARAAQESECRSHAAKAGYEVAKVFIDDGSANADDRPGLTEMVAFLSKGPGKVVVTTEPARLARRIDQYEKLIASIGAAGASLEMPHLSEADPFHLKLTGLPRGR